MATALNWEALARHRAVLLKTYGSKTARKWKQFLFDLFSVSCGVKRAWLVDYFQPDAEKLQSVMGSVLNHEPNFNRKDMCTVSINDDLLVVNIEDALSACEELIQAAASAMGDWTRHQHSLSAHAGVYEFVVLNSSCNQHRATEDELSHILTEMLPVAMTLKEEVSAVKCVSPAHLVSPDIMCIPHVAITAPEGVNLCTLFGWLLGYPFVYWFPYSNGGFEVGGLSMVPLTCYKVCYVSSEAVTDSSSTSAGMRIGVETDHHPLVLYSFSVPTSVLTSNPFISKVVHEWFERIKVSSSKLLNVSIQMTTTCLTLPHVIL